MAYRIFGDEIYNELFVEASTSVSTTSTSKIPWDIFWDALGIYGWYAMK